MGPLRERGRHHRIEAIGVQLVEGVGWVTPKRGWQYQGHSTGERSWRGRWVTREEAILREN